jgi:anti-sigma-K factor RskA
MKHEEKTGGAAVGPQDQESRHEAQINSLLDGELDDAQAAALRQAAESDAALAQAIIEAYQLRAELANLPQERAPDSLRQKLQRIPAEHAPRTAPARTGKSSGQGLRWFQPRWVMALAAVPLVILIGLYQPGPREAEDPGRSLAGPTPPTAAELAQARQDLALAFAYLDKAGRVTGREIEYTIGTGMRDPVKENTVRTIAEQFDLNEEQDT